MTNTDSLQRRIAWATKYGEAALDRGDRRAAAVYSKIANDARAELARLTEVKS